MLMLICNVYNNVVTEHTMNRFKFQALAGGTILYVCMFEILEREKNKKNVSRMLQLLFVILGVVSLLTIEILGNKF